MKYRGLGAGKSRGNSHPYLGSPGDLCEPGQSGADPEFPSQAESVHGESQHPWEQQPRGKGQLKGFGATRAGLSGWFLSGCETRAHRGHSLAALRARTFSCPSQRKGMENPEGMGLFGPPRSWCSSAHPRMSQAENSQL